MESASVVRQLGISADPDWTFLHLWNELAPNLQQPTKYVLTIKGKA